MSRTVVVDSSVFVAALRSVEGGSRQVLRLCIEGRLTPLMGHKLMLEFLDVNGRHELFVTSPATRSDRHELLQGFLSVCRWVNVFFLWRPNLPDEGDNHVLELAIAGGAESVITHNVSDFEGELKFPDLVVQTPAQFLRSMR